MSSSGLGVRSPAKDISGVEEVNVAHTRHVKEPRAKVSSAVPGGVVHSDSCLETLTAINRPSQTIRPSHPSPSPTLLRAASHEITLSQKRITLNVIRNAALSTLRKQFARRGGVVPRCCSPLVGRLLLFARRRSVCCEVGS